MEYICDHCKKQVNCKMQPSRDVVFDCGMYEKRKEPTNAERIRAMSDEELVEFLEPVLNCEYECYARKDGCYEGCKERIRKWLKSPIG